MAVDTGFTNFGGTLGGAEDATGAWMDGGGEGTVRSILTICWLCMEENEVGKVGIDVCSIFTAFWLWTEENEVGGTGIDVSSAFIFFWLCRDVKGDVVVTDCSILTNCWLCRVEKDGNSGGW